MVGCARIFKFESTLNDCMICMCATVSHMKNRASSMRKNVKKRKTQQQSKNQQRSRGSERWPSPCGLRPVSKASTVAGESPEENKRTKKNIQEQATATETNHLRQSRGQKKHTRTSTSDGEQEKITRKQHSKSLTISGSNR